MKARDNQGVSASTHVSRPRLVGRLMQAIALGCKLIVVKADAGYGKTTLVSELCHSGGLKSQWRTLSAADRDVARFADGLETCLRHLSSRGSSKPVKRPRAHRLSTPDVTILANRLVDEAAGAGPGPAVLILDDYHQVNQVGEVGHILCSLIERSPAPLRFVVISRATPHLLLAKLRARQAILVLEEQDLTFTREETARLLQSDGGAGIDDSVVGLVQQRTEGWAAGIAMVSQSLRYGRQEKLMAVLADPVASAWLVYDYLAEEVFDQQNSDLQRFLVVTSILERMNGPLCDLLLATASSQNTLLHLEDAGLFTTSADLHRRDFTYHQLFLQFLRHKLAQRFGREEVEALHLKAAQYFERKEQWEECIHHYLRANEAVKAAQVVESIGLRQIQSGFVESVERWLRVLPENLSTTRPWLLAMRGRLSHMSVRDQEAIYLLEKASRAFEELGDEDGRAWAEGELGYAHFRRRNLHEAARHLTSALGMARSGTMLKSMLLLYRAMAYREIGMLEDSLASCREADQELATVDDEVDRTWCRSRIKRITAHAQMEMGSLVDAQRTAREALEFCERHQIGEYEEAWALAQLGAATWARGHLEEAEELERRAMSLYGRNVKHQQHVIGHLLGNCLRDQNRYDEAQQAYAQSAGEGELEALYLGTLLGQGQALRERAVELYERYRLSESVAVRSTAEVVFATVMRECGQEKESLEHLREAARLLTAARFRLRLSSTLLHQAGIEYKLSRLSDARVSLTRAMEIAAFSHFYHFYWWDADLIALLCQKAIAEDIHVDFASQLAIRRLDQRAVNMFAPLLNDRRPSVRRTAQAVVTSLLQQGASSTGVETLSGCTDLTLRSHLIQATEMGLVSPTGLRLLRTRHGLTWREIEIMVEYYLRPDAGTGIPTAPLRQECADRLGISENTLRCHVNNIRQKLDLPRWVSKERVRKWAEEGGLLANLHSDCNA